MNNKKATLIIGEHFYVKKQNKIYVNKRSWLMLMLFVNAIKDVSIIFHHKLQDSTHDFELPNGVVNPILLEPTETSIPHKFFSRLKILCQISKTISKHEIIYLRLPSWKAIFAFFIAFMQNKKIVTSIHGDWEEGYDWKEEKLLHKKAYKILLSTIVHYLIKVIVKFSISVFYVGKKLKSKYTTSNEKSTVIANFLHTHKDIYFRQDSSLSNPVKVLYVGRLERYKGVKYLIQAIKSLTDQNIDIKLILVGEGSTKNNLKELVRRLNIEKRVQFRGYLQHGKDLLNTYKNCDFFVLPSISSEGMPKVVMEAFTQGVPVIATNVGSVKFILDNSQNGLLIPPRDFKAISQSLLTLINDEKIRKTLISNGYQLAKQEVREKQIERIEQAWKKIT